MAVKRGLVVDDSKAARTMLKKLLEKNGLEIDTVESGEDALNFLTRNRPDVVFMDHMMPGMDGLQTTQAITSNPETAMIPVIMFTSKEGDEYQENARAHGAIGFLAKPPSPANVAEVIKELGGIKADDAPGTYAPPPVTPVVTSEPSTQEKAHVSADWVKDLARNEAEATAKRMLEALTDQRLQEWSKQYQHEMSRQLEDSIGEQLSAALQNFETHQERHIEQALGSKLEHAAKSQLGDLVENAVVKHVDHQMVSHIQDIQSKVREQIDVIRSSINTKATVDPSILDEIKALAKTSAIGAAQNSAQTIASRTAQSAAETVAQRLIEEERSRFGKEINALKSASKGLVIKAILFGAISGATVSALISYLL